MEKNNAAPKDELDEFSPEQFQTIDDIMEKNRGKQGALIPVLEKVQEVLGYLPRAIQRRVAEGLNIPVAKVYGVVSFYSLFTMTPRGRHNIRVCLGTACYVRGGQKIFKNLSDVLGIKHGGCTEDKRFSLETVRCLGVCGLAPVIVADADTHSQVKLPKLEEILDQYK